MEPHDYIEAITNISAALASAASVDSSAAVPSCPGWQVRDVISHVAQVQRWATGPVTSTTPARSDVEPAPEGLSDPELVTWARAQTAGLIAALSDADPDDPAWTFGLPRTNRFWFRRQAMEGAIHAWDAQSAIGDADPIPGELAVDGLDEFLDLMLPRMVKGSADLWGGESVHLHRTDGEGEWLVTLGPNGTTQVERAHLKGTLAVRGSASDLFLWVSNRKPITMLESFGDADLAERWRLELQF
jgi:uncharacterized protein (TIGR03083 family)